MIDWDAVNYGISYTDNSTSTAYYDSVNNVWFEYRPPDVYIPSGIPSGMLVPALKPKLTRKEKTMIDRQTFLDALADEGKPADSEGREIVKEAKADKWELFIARLLARVFESTDLTMLKEKPKEVLIKEA